MISTSDAAAPAATDPTRARWALGEIAALAVLGATGSVLLPMIFGAGLAGRMAMVVVIELLVIAVIVYGLRRRGQSAAALGLSFAGLRRDRILGTFWRSVLVFFAATIAFIMAGQAIAPLLPPMDPQAVDGGGINTPLMLIGSLLTVWITASFMEEVIYRAFLLSRLQEVLGSGLARNAAVVFIGGIVFGLIHWHWGAVGVVQTTAMGWVLGAAYLRYRDNLWINILAHGYMDTLLLVGVYASSAG